MPTAPHEGHHPLAHPRRIDSPGAAQGTGGGRAVDHRAGRPLLREAAQHLGDRRADRELHRTQGHVDWLGSQVAARPQDANLLAVYAAERGHLAKLAGQMVSGKLDERRSLLNEEGAERLELAIAAIIRDLGHDPNAVGVRSTVALRLRRAAGQYGPCDK